MKKLFIILMVLFSVNTLYGAITVNTIDKPYLWVEATTGGSLSAATYYFIGFEAFESTNGPYYGYCPGQVSDQVSVTTDATNNNIKMEIYQQGGSVTAYADTGDSTHVTVTTSVAHGKSNGDTVYLRGTTNYTGYYTISSVTSNTFDIVATWVSDDGASKWFSNTGTTTKPTSYPHTVAFFFKWDYYSMLRGDGTPFQWLNTNDTAAGGGVGITNEWVGTSTNHSTYGHTRWGGSYYYVGYPSTSWSTSSAGTGSYKYRYLSAVSITSSQVQWNTTNLYERSDTTSNSVNGLMAHPQISMRKYTDSAGTIKGYALPDGMSDTASAILIFIDNSDYNNNWRDLITALKSANVIGGSAIISYDAKLAGTSADETKNNFLAFRGLIIVQNATFTTQPVWYFKTIEMFHSRITCGSTTDQSKMLKLSGCLVSNFALAQSFWEQPTVSVEDTRWMSDAALILDNFYAVNFTPSCTNGTMTAYTSKDGWTFAQKRSATTGFVQQLRGAADASYNRNIKYIGFNCYIEVQSAALRTWELTNIEFTNIYSDVVHDSYGAYKNCDIEFSPNVNTNGLTVYRTVNCYNVTSSERSNGLVRVAFCLLSAGPLYNTDSVMIFNFFNPINLKVTDVDGNAIENATVTIQNSKEVPSVYTDTTDSSGDIDAQNVLCYTVEYSPNDEDSYASSSSGNTYKFYSKTTVFNDLTLTIDKDGYETYNGVLSDVLAEKNLTIALTSKNYKNRIYDSVLYDATIN